MSGGTKVQTTTSEPWKEQIPYLTQGFDQAKQIYNQGIPDYYPGETIAGFSPAQKAAQQATLGYAMGPRAAAQQQAAESSLVQGLSGQIDPNAYNPMANALTQQVLGNLKGSILPGLRQQTLTYQPGGGSRGNLVQNKAIANAVTSGLTKPMADMYTNAYNQAQQRAVQSGQLYPSIMGAPMSMYGAMADVGAQRQGMRQRQMDADMARYQYNATAPQQALANYMNMISGNYGGTVQKTTPGQSPLSSIASLASAFMAPSDMRIKENIVSDGTTYNGHNVYHFNFIGDDVRRRGVMAQEVEKIRPDAVVEIDGIKHVNYGAL